jgi:peptidoglycan hydrolase-like protein with peptidoglycan-binding domain
MRKMLQLALIAAVFSLAGGEALAFGGCKYRMNPNLIRAIQRGLASKGYDVGKPDGRMTKETKRAMEAYGIMGGNPKRDTRLIRSLLPEAEEGEKEPDLRPVCGVKAE